MLIYGEYTRTIPNNIGFRSLTVVDEKFISTSTLFTVLNVTYEWSHLYNVIRNVGGDTIMVIFEPVEILQELKVILKATCENELPLNSDRMLAYTVIYITN